MAKKKLLSICICTLKEREKSFNNLISELKRQIKNSRNPNDYEILIDCTERGMATIGYKREKLKRIAKGKYIVYLDDDDMISGKYIDLITEAMYHNVDIISFGVDFYRNGIFGQTVYYNRFLDRQNEDSWNLATNLNASYNYTHNFYCTGSAYHLLPVKKTLADQVCFIDANVQEDHLYSEALKPLIQSEFHIPHVLYIVNSRQ